MEYPKFDRDLQPIFGKIKSAFFDVVNPLNQFKVNSSALCVLMDSSNMYYGKKSEIFLMDCKKWLDNLDIRGVREVIDFIILSGGKLPKWVANKRFTIDYNKKGCLDLIKL